MNLESLLNLVFPSHCIGCQGTAGNSIICSRCLAGIPINQTLFCGKCRLRLARQKKICHKDYPFVLGAATSYSNELAKELIHYLKFKFVKSAARALGELLAVYMRGTGFSPKNFIVIPVPLSARRLRERGFNQSGLVAERFATLAGLAAFPGVLLRIRDARPQSESKNADERRKNVRGAFVVKNPELVSGKNIILLDDVITSGATMLEAARTLKAAGARRIIALAAMMA